MGFDFGPNTSKLSGGFALVGGSGADPDFVFTPAGGSIRLGELVENPLHVRRDSLPIEGFCVPLRVIGRAIRRTIV